MQATTFVSPFEPFVMAFTSLAVLLGTVDVGVRYLLKARHAVANEPLDD